MLRDPAVREGGGDGGVVKGVENGLDEFLLFDAVFGELDEGSLHEVRVLLVEKALDAIIFGDSGVSEGRLPGVAEGESASWSHHKLLGIITDLEGIVP